MLTYELYSYWLFIWSILHYSGIIKPSPLIFLIIAIIIVHLVLLYFVIRNKLSNYTIIKKIISNTYMKFIPIYLIFKKPLINEIDLQFGFIITYLYIIILLINKKNPIKIYLDLDKTESIHNYLYDKSYGYLRNTYNYLLLLKK